MKLDYRSKHISTAAHSTRLLLLLFLLLTLPLSSFACYALLPPPYVNADELFCPPTAARAGTPHARMAYKHHSASKRLRSPDSLALYRPPENHGSLLPFRCACMVACTLFIRFFCSSSVSSNATPYVLTRPQLLRNIAAIRHCRRVVAPPYLKTLLTTHHAAGFSLRDCFLRHADRRYTTGSAWRFNLPAGRGCCDYTCLHRRGLPQRIRWWTG